MVKSLLQSVLERHGLAEIPAQGETFDPTVHEAVGVDTQCGLEPGVISHVVQQGYSMGERVIRPAKVMVAAASQDGPGADQPAPESPSQPSGHDSEPAADS